MIDRHALLSDLQSLLRSLEADLLERTEAADALSQIGAYLQDEHTKARDADRTAQNFEDWRSDFITQVAAAWVLSCVFARFLEDNELVDPPKLAGPGDRLRRARDENEFYFRSHPTETDREYLLAVFEGLAMLPGASEIFGEHNPIHELPNWLSGDAAGELLGFFQKIDANTGELIHDFTDPEWNTRFLGDLYQDLSEAARKKYALLQTPDFVEEFILDRTLEPALDEFGLTPGPVTNADGTEIAPAGFRMIDPACGSGHFLLGAFKRILDRWRRQEPGAKDRDLVQRSLNSVCGVDVNPFAIAIARFRLLLAALRESKISRLKDAPDFTFQLVSGDSLVHGAVRDVGKKGAAGNQSLMSFHELSHHYAVEDAGLLSRILRPGSYHAVVANPPYITVKDKALSQAYRERYGSCHRQYSLSVPFMERIFRLAIDSEQTSSNRAGFTGQITANSFMKREFGKKLIETYLPRWDLTHMVDTSGTYLPGHGTPTVILFGRNRRPAASTIRAVMGIRGEPATPKDPAKAEVWTAILDQIDQPGSESSFVSVSDTPRESFHSHPWSIGGGGAAEMKETIESGADTILDKHIDTVCSLCLTRADEAYLCAAGHLLRQGILPEHMIVMGQGEQLRDWSLHEPDAALFPYEEDGSENRFTPVRLIIAPRVHRLLWPYREELWRRRELGGDHRQLDRTWWEWNRFLMHRFRVPLSIPFAFVSTHNHFMLDRGGRIFKQSAPVIKLPAESSELDHLALIGLLNSATACFWMKQVFHNKGSSVDQHGARQRTLPFEDFWEYDGTKIKQFPIPWDVDGSECPLREETIAFARDLDALARARESVLPAALLAGQGNAAITRAKLDEAESQASGLLTKMIAKQEEIDWLVYRAYGLLEDADAEYSDAPTITLGERAFEIVMARKIAAGELQTEWFRRHGSTPITELPGHWPESYKRVIERRIAIIETNKDIGLIEQPEYKRRWNTELWESMEERALRAWLLDRLERYFDFDGRMNDEGRVTAKLDIRVVSLARLADVAQADDQFQEVGRILTDDPAFGVLDLVTDLVRSENVPLLPAHRYKPSGLRKRAEWEKTWALQRAEDAIDQRTELPEGDPQRLTPEQAKRLKQDQIGDIPVPPRYTIADFISTGGARYWSLRGKLDVPKERWVGFPHCEGEDGTLVIAWAGYDHLQLAKVIADYYVEVKERLGGAEDPRLVPLLAGLLELLPWLKQWHNEIDPEFNVPMGDYYEGFINDEAKQMGKTLDEIRAWEPPKRTNRRRTAAKGGPNSA